MWSVRAKSRQAKQCTIFLRLTDRLELSVYISSSPEPMYECKLGTCLQEKKAQSDAQLTTFEADLNDLEKWLQQADKDTDDDRKLEVL